MAPSFLRTLLYPNVDQLQLPTTFVSKHMSNQFPKDIKILSANGRCTWRLKIHKNGENYFFGNGWKTVVEDAQLCILDSMTFKLVDKSTFKMVIYTKDGCKKDLPPKSHVQDNVDVLSGPIAGPIATATPAFNMALSLNVLHDDDDDDDDEEVMFDKMLAQSHYERLPLPAEFVKLARIESKRTLILKNHDGKEWSVGVRSATSSGVQRYRLSSGWIDFWRSNSLSVGDKCVFKYVRSEDKLCLVKVAKKKSPENAPHGSSD